MGQRNRSANDTRSYPSPARRLVRRGFSLVEILLVVGILGVVALATIPMFQANLVDELQNAAEIVAADLQRARNLAVANNSPYKLVFNDDLASYYLTHSGANSALNTLPAWPYRQATDPATRHTTFLTSLPGISSVEIVGVVRLVSGSRERVTDLEFSPLGSTTRTQNTEVWLAAGAGSARRYQPITIHAVTGLATIGDITGAPPSFEVD